MTYNAPISLILALHAALQKPPRSDRGQQCGQAAAARFSREPWVFITDISEEVEMHDRRFSRLGDLDDFWYELCRMFEMPVQWVTYRPASHRSDFDLRAAVTPVDAAAIFVRLERLGFMVNARPFVDAVKASLHRQRLITEAGFDVLFFENTRDREQIRISTDDFAVPTPAAAFQTEHGYMVEFAQAGDRAELLVRGPLYKVAKPQYSVTCAYCGMQYMRRNFDSVLAHRERHYQKRRCYSPKPDDRLLHRLDTEIEGDRVDADSPIWMHLAVYDRAVMFKSEMKTDRTQWQSPPESGRITETGVAHLLSTPTAPGVIVGACAFRQQRREWTLDWVWLAPMWRRHGVLQRYWPRFLETYGDFQLEAISAEMQAFVFRHGTAQQRELLRSSH